jgi:Spy/CpxP family protein refolding chaperone
MKHTHLLLALAVVAAPLAAQQPPADTARRPTRPMGHGMMQGHMHGMMMGPMQGRMMGMMEMMGPMMRGMAFAPAHLLDHKDALELTPQQVTRLTALRDAAKLVHDAAHTEAQTHRDALAEAMKAAAPDTVKVKQHFQAMQAAMGRAHWAMLSAAAQARGVLTEVQRGRVEGWADAMQHMMMQRRHDMMGAKRDSAPARRQ